MHFSNHSRRSFIKKSSAALAVGTLLPYVQGFPAIVGSKQKKVGIALVGLGYYSSKVLAPAFAHCDTAYLAGVVTGTPEKEKTWADQYGIKKENIYNYENFDDIASNRDIDIIYVVLPNSMHKEYVIRAAKAGKHVICEKPMALNAQDCREMIDACAQAGVKLSIGYRMQFEPYTQHVMHLGQDKVYGAVKLIDCGAGYNHTNFDHWKLDKSMGGGAMMDMGVYPLQAARYVTGQEPVSVSAQTFKNRPEHFDEVDEITAFQLKFPDGAVANLVTSFHASFNYLKTRAEKGFFELEPFSSYSGIAGKSSDGVFDFPAINQQAAQMDEVAMGVLEDKPMRVPGEEGLKDMIVVDAVYASIKSGGKTIPLV